VHHAYDFNGLPATCGRPFHILNYYKGAVMKSGYASALAAILCFCSTLWAAESPQGVTNMGNVRGGDVTAAQSIIDKKCTACHSGKTIDAAIFANKDMVKIQQEMEKKGAGLNANERDVLGIYWKQQNPLKKNK
jgi:uncharacterized membrane protein